MKVFFLGFCIALLTYKQIKAQTPGDCPGEVVIPKERSMDPLEDVAVSFLERNKENIEVKKKPKTEAESIELVEGYLKQLLSNPKQLLSEHDLILIQECYDRLFYKISKMDPRHLFSPDGQRISKAFYGIFSLLLYQKTNVKPLDKNISALIAHFTGKYIVKNLKELYGMNSSYVGTEDGSAMVAEEFYRTMMGEVADDVIGGDFLPSAFNKNPSNMDETRFRASIYPFIIFSLYMNPLRPYVDKSPTGLGVISSAVRDCDTFLNEYKTRFDFKKMSGGQTFEKYAKTWGDYCLGYILISAGYKNNRDYFKLIEEQRKNKK